jgi:tungstate transport system permease protein
MTAVVTCSLRVLRRQYETRTRERANPMNDILQGLSAAFWLVVSLDAELIDISLRSLRVTLTALLISCLIAIPLGAYLAVQRFRYRRLVIAVINALMGLPPVVVGLVVYLLLSRAGPFGVLGLLFTPTAMIIAQVIIITPLIASIAHQAMRELWAEYHDLLISLNTSKWQRIKTLIWDGRRNLLTAALAGFGRAIGEVGAIMIVGGNIDNVTRVLTTAIALETGKGDFALALGLGFVLIGLSMIVSVTIHSLSRTEQEGRW